MSAISRPLAAPAPGHRVWRALVVTIFSAAFLFFVVRSWRWPLIHDMQVMHYVSFLIDRGWKPYVQIGDMNMPGAYLFEGWALHTFGSSDLGWRLYDFSLCATLTLSMIAIARRSDWIAGLIAGGTFTLAHAAEGPRNAGQRDEVMAVLLILACAFLFAGVRSRRAWPLFFFGLLSTLAGSIKPSVVLFLPAALLIGALRLRREQVPLSRYLYWALAGFAVASAIVLAFLVRHGAVRAFVFDVTEVLPHYMTLAHPRWSSLIAGTLQPPIALFVLCAVIAAVLAKQSQNWEEAVLLLGIGFGLLNFFGQRKGFFQHRYTLLVFVILWASIQLVSALRGPRSAQWVAGAGLALAILVYVPRNLYWITTWKPYDYFSEYLERDLDRLGVQNLQGQIQCLDIVDGCLNALYHLKIVQTTGATGDLLYFLPKDAPVVEEARGSYWKSLQAGPPAVFVMSNWQFGEKRNFNKIDTWPAFAGFLRSNYVLAEQREFDHDDRPTSHPGSEADHAAYRIYIRRGSPLASIDLAVQ